MMANNAARSITLSSISSRFRRVSWKDRAIVSLLALAVLGAASWRISNDPLTAVGISAAAIVGLNILLAVLPWINIAFVWIVNLMLLPIGAGLFGALVTQENGLDPGTYSFGMLTLITSSILFTVLAYKYAPGRLWINLLIIFLIQNFLSAAILIYFFEVGLDISNVGVFFGIFCATLYLVVRIIISKKRKTVNIPRSRPADIATLSAKIKNAHIKGNNAVLVENKKERSENGLEPDFAVVSPKSVTLIYARNGESPVGADKKGRLTYEGNRIEDFTVAVLASAKSVASKVKRREMAVVISGPRLMHTSQPAMMELSTREGQYVGTATYVNTDGLARVLKKLPRGSEVTPDQTEALKKLFAGSAEESNEDEQE